MGERINRVLLLVLCFLWHRLARRAMGKLPTMTLRFSAYRGQLYPTEINSMAMRTKGAALGTATNW
jgi:hypothetical protein